MGSAGCSRAVLNERGLLATFGEAVSLLIAGVYYSAVLALEGMVNLLGELYGLARHQALGIASVVVDLRITQIVNQVKGVHAVLPHDAL